MCQAIQEDCSACSACTDEAEEYYGCVAIGGGCSSFECPKVEYPTEAPAVDTPGDGIRDIQPPSGGSAVGLHIGLFSLIAVTVSLCA